MKQVLVAIALLASANAFAVEIKDARLNSNNDIEVDVVYGGGCHEHTFALKIEACFETMPVRCPATVVDTTAKPDFCEALISRTVTFKLEDNGLLDNYFSGASLFFSGDNNSTATVILPIME